MENLPLIYSWFISAAAAVYVWLVRSNFYTVKKKGDLMLDNKNLFNEMYKCRLCPAKFNNPEELRIHRVVDHKGHMLQLNIKH